MARCNATSKRTGKQCGAQALTGNVKCRHHGGKSLAGPAAAAWKDGRHSKVLPKRLLADAQSSLNDPDKLALNAEIALVDARAADLLRRVDSGESGELWRQLRQTWREYEAARKANDTVGLVQAISLLGETITRGHGDAAAWAELGGWIERRRKLVESERKRQIEAQQMIHVEQAVGLMNLLINAVRSRVRDEDIMLEITQEYSRLIGKPIPETDPARGAKWNA